MLPQKRRMARRLGGRVWGKHVEEIVKQVFLVDKMEILEAISPILELLVVAISGCAPERKEE